MKTCTKCGEAKQLSEFGNDRSKKDGLRPDCKSCVNLRNKKWQNSNPEKQKECNANWQKNNPKKCIEYTTKYKENNPEKVATSQSEWNKRNPDKVYNKNRTWRDSNPDKVSQQVNRVLEKKRIATEFKHLGGEAYSG